MGTSGNRDYQRASRSALKDFTDDALTISAGSLFQNGTALLKASPNCVSQDIPSCETFNRVSRQKIASKIASNVW